MSDTTPAPSRPLPQADEISQEFFDGAMEGRLMLMKCAGCGALRLPSRRHCDVCLSDQTEWVQASGRGVVRSFGIMHQRYHPGFQTPYNVAFVELDVAFACRPTSPGSRMRRSAWACRWWSTGTAMRTWRCRSSGRHRPREPSPEPR